MEVNYTEKQALVLNAINTAAYELANVDGTRQIREALEQLAFNVQAGFAVPQGDQGMITADKLTLLTNMPAAMLTMGIHAAGYKMHTALSTVKFLGMTNAGLFCYATTWKDSDGDMRRGKVFVKYDPTADKVSVGY
jgi:hypothetical protein